VTERTLETTNHVGRARNAWGGALGLGAASVMVLALSPNFPSVVSEWGRWGHEAPVVVATAPDRRSERPEPATPAPEATAAARPLGLELVGTVTDPDDTRAAVVLDGIVWVASGGGLLRLDPTSPDLDRWWTTADGLPDHRLTAISAFGDGLAVGTEGGAVVTLALPDGAGPVEVRTIDTPSTSRVSDLVGEGELLWVATWGSGAFSGVPGNPQGFRELGPSRGLRARQLTGIARLGDELVAGTAGAGLWVRKDSGDSTMFVARGGLISDFVLDVRTVGDRVLVAGPGGVSRYRDGVVQTMRGGDRVPAGVVRAVGGRGELALTGGRLGRWGDTETEAWPSHPDGLGPWHGVPLPEARWVADVGGRSVVGTARGVLLADAGSDGGTLRWRVHGGPGSNDLTSVSSEDGVVLVGTFDGGAWLGAERWSALPTPSGEINDVLLADGVAWLGTSRGLARVQDGALRSWGPAQGLGHEHVGALADSEGGLLVGTSAGVQRFDGVGFEPLGGDAASELRNVYAIAGGRDGTWVGTLEGAWALGERDAARVRYETGELPDSWVNAVAVGPDGRVWAGTYDRGIATRSPDGRWASLTEAGGLPCGWVNPGAMLALPDGTTLVGTMGGGLLRVDPAGPVDRWTARDGLAGDDVTGLARDGDTVWVATRSGLSRLLITPAPEVGHVADRS
jgi:ligand-binding sensor domain-containing protein